VLAATDEGNEIIETQVNSPSLEYHSHVLTGSVPEDANELKAATEALEEEKARPYYTAENPDDPFDLHMHNTNQTLARQRPIELIQVAVRFNDPLIPNLLSDEKPALFDTGANASFISLRLVELWGLKIIGRPSSIKNGDGTVQYSPGQVNIKVFLAYGLKVNVCLTVAPLARYDMIIGLDMIKRYQMSLAFNPLRLTAVSPTLPHKVGTKQKVPKRINIPTCALASFDAEGRDTSAYACDAVQFNNLRRLDDLYGEDDVFVVTPSDNDCLNYNLLVKELFDLANKCSAEEFTTVAHTLLKDLAEQESDQQADIGEDSSKTKFTAPGPFKIEKLVGNNAVEIMPTGPYRALHKIVNVEYLRPYNRRPQAVGHPPSQDRTAPILIDPDGREWFIVAEILSHRQINRPGPNQKVRVRFEGFDSTYDEWLPRKDVTDAALIEYEKFLEKNASDNGFEGDAQKAYTSFVGAHKTFSLLHKPTQGAVEKRTTTRRESRNDAGRAAGSVQQESAKTSRVSGRVVGRKTTRYSDL
jgi:hypothetical protein